MISPRYFHKGDYITIEGPVLKADKKPNGWAEWCTTWTDGWAYNNTPFYSSGFILGNLARARSLDINVNLGVGPDAQGETADIPATAAGNVRYLFACPQYNRDNRAMDKDMLPLADVTMTLHGLKAAPKSVNLLGDGKAVENDYKDGVLTVRLPVSRRTNLPDVVKVELP